MKYWIVVAALILAGCAAEPKKTQQEQLSPEEALLEQSYQALSGGDVVTAAADLDRLITRCDKKYTGSKERIYASRGTTETLYYMLKAAAEKQDAIAVSSTCADALYWRGYAALDLNQVDVAESYLHKAIEMSPVNAMYLSELGHIYHIKRDWHSALDVFAQAEKYAQTYSPDELKLSELTRAKRGVGYSLIELGELDKAELKFKECLAIDRNDQSALRELKYIEQLRGQMPAHSEVYHL